MRIDKSDCQLLDRITDGRSHLSVVVCNVSIDGLTDPVIRSPHEVIEAMNRSRDGVDRYLETKKC